MKIEKAQLLLTGSRPRAFQQDQDETRTSVRYPKSPKRWLSKNWTCIENCNKFYVRELLRRKAVEKGNVFA